jgi:hypothetical protein
MVKLGAEKREVEVRIVEFCDLESKSEFRIATDLPLEGEGGVSNQGKRILTILDQMNFMWVAYPRFRHI